MEPLRRPPIAFAHRGGLAHGPDNTLEAFSASLRLGATGLETDAWLTSDGAVVLDHGGRARAGLRARPISSLARNQLPDRIPTLDDLYAACGTGFELSVDVKDQAAAEVVVAVARSAGDGAEGRLWLCHPDWERLAEWRAQPTYDGVHLVDSTRLRALHHGPERRAAQLSEAGIDAVNLHWTDWTGGLVTLFHRFGRLAFGWDAQHERMIREVAEMGIDGVYSDHVDRLMTVLGPGHDT